MSAFLCDDCHLTALASYYCAVNPSPASPQSVLETLRGENLKSLEACYPNRMAALDAPRLCPTCSSGEKPHTAIIKAAQCYRYQACEHPGWADSDACRIVESILEHALRQLASTGGPSTIEALQRTEAYGRERWRWLSCPRKTSVREPVDDDKRPVVLENALGGRGGTKRPFRVEGDHAIYGMRRVVAQVSTLERARTRMAADRVHTNKRIIDLRTGKVVENG